jgi:hypothetical protein
MMSLSAKRRADTERLEAQLAEWAAVIASYRARAKRAEAGARIELDRITDELQAKRKVAGEQEQRLRKASDSRWERAKVDLECSWEDIREAFRLAAGRF